MLFFSSCKPKQEERYYPIKDTKMSEGIYQKYKLRLDTANMKDDPFDIGVQLSNLNAPSDKVFEQIELDIKKNQQNCFEVYDQHKLFSEHNFKTNLVKSDTLKFVQAYELCVEMLGEQTFIDYQIEKEIKHQKKIAQREVLDTTAFNFELINELRKIERDDQFYRKKLNKKGITEAEKKELWKKQHEIDSINLLKVDRILAQGYPSKYEVGYDNLSSIWLVLQHQADLNVRLKYLPILKQAVNEGKLSKGLMNTYEKRNEFIRLSE